MNIKIFIVSTCSYVRLTPILYLPALSHSPLPPLLRPYSPVCMRACMQVCIIKPPAKRMRIMSGPGMHMSRGGSSGGGGSASAATPAERAKSKMLVDIGIAKKGSSSAAKFFSNGGSSKQPVKVTRKVTVHKPGQAPSSTVSLGSKGQSFSGQQGSRPTSRLLATPAVPSQQQARGQGPPSSNGRVPVGTKYQAGQSGASGAGARNGPSQAGPAAAVSYEEQRARLKAAMAKSIAKELADNASGGGQAAASPAQAAGKKRPQAFRDDDFGF